MLLWRICKTARMLQGSILSEARIVSAFSVVLCSRVCVPSPRASTLQDSKSRTYTRKSSIHVLVSANVARSPANSMLRFRRIPGVSSSPSACSLPSQGCSNLSLEGIRITSLGPLVMAMRVMLHQLLDYCARPLPQAPRLCLMVRIAGDQVNTTAGSGACGTAWHARGVAKSICIGCPFSTSRAQLPWRETSPPKNA